LTPMADQANSVGDTVSLPVTATTTVGPIVYSATGLPDGLTIDPTSGVITGTPTTEQTVTVTLTATSSTIADSLSFTWTISPAPVAASITSGPPPDATIDWPYDFTVTATGLPTPTFSITAGALPPGLTLDPSSGAISGTPTTAGSYRFTVTASNRAGANAQPYTLTVLGLPLITSGPPPNGIVGSPYLYTVTATGFPAPTFSVTAGALPAGLTLDPSSGVISGTPTTSGQFTFAVTATNSVGRHPTTFSITIDPAPVVTTMPSTSTTVPLVGELPASGSGSPASASITGAVLIGLGGLLLLLRRGRTRQT
jgi:hypothetical protein